MAGTGYSDANLLVFGQVERGIAAIIDIRLVEPPPLQQRRHHLVGHRAGDRGHGCYEDAGER